MTVFKKEQRTPKMKQACENFTFNEHYYFDQTNLTAEMLDSEKILIEVYDNKNTDKGCNKLMNAVKACEFKNSTTITYKVNNKVSTPIVKRNGEAINVTVNTTTVNAIVSATVAPISEDDDAPVERLVFSFTPVIMSIDSATAEAQKFTAEASTFNVSSVNIPAYNITVAVTPD